MIGADQTGARFLRASTMGLFLLSDKKAP